MVLFYALVLTLDDGTNIRRQVLLQRALIGALRRVLAALNFREHGGIVFAGDGGFDVHPPAMRRTCSGAALVGIAAERADLRLQFGSTFCTALSRFLKHRFQLCVFDSVGAGFESLLAVLARFNEFVHRRNHVFLIHCLFLSCQLGRLRARSGSRSCWLVSVSTSEMQICRHEINTMPTWRFQIRLRRAAAALIVGTIGARSRSAADVLPFANTA